MSKRLALGQCRRRRRPAGATHQTLKPKPLLARTDSLNQQQMLSEASTAELTDIRSCINTWTMREDLYLRLLSYTRARGIIGDPASNNLHG